MLLTLLLSCIWIIRGHHFCVATETTTCFCLMVLTTGSVLVQVINIWYILWEPWHWSSEAMRGYIFVADLAACTADVIMTDHRHPPPFTSGIIVHTVHGWYIPFAGVRLSTEFLLHGINFECFVIVRICHWLYGGELHAATFCLDCLKLLCFNSILPMLVNMSYEARLRVQFSKRQDAQSISPVWLTILSYTSIGASWRQCRQRPTTFGSASTA